jgi:RNase P protein component
MTSLATAEQVQKFEAGKKVLRDRIKRLTRQLAKIEQDLEETKAEYANLLRSVGTNDKGKETNGN